MPLNRRDFLRKTAMASATFCTLSIPGCDETDLKKPNIIYILADDLGYGDLGCFGQEKIKTPHLDRMAREGTMFTQHYAGSTVCAPSRCALMTGKHIGHCTIRGNVDVLMKPEEVTIGKVLKKAGYDTACIGKWGIGHPPPPSDPHDNGFDYSFGYLSMWHAHNHYPEFLWKNGKKVKLSNVVQHPKKHYKENQENLVGLASEKNEYSSDLFTQDALNYIEKHTEKPFFLFLSYSTPHANNEASQFGSHGMEVPDQGIYKDKEWPEPEKCKAAMISRLDGDVGAVLAKLKEKGLDSNTLVIFTSDNGPHKEGGVKPEFFKSSGPFRGIKRDLYDGGIRVPTIARWPGKVKAGNKNDHISAFWDMLPTFAELAGESVPEDIDGISMAPALLGKPNRQHKYLYWEFHEGSSKQALRMEKWKAVRLAPSKAIELYDITEDLLEENNIADKHPETIAKAESILKNVRSDTETWPLKDKGSTMPF